MHVLVTGASSFIGRHVTLALSLAGLRVTATYRSSDSVIERLKSAARDADLVRLDLARESDFQTLPSRVDCIIHVAGVSAMPGISADDILACNVTGARNLLNYARNVQAS